MVPQYRPLQVWEEALVLFSVNIGFYDNVAVKDALRVERAYARLHAGTSRRSRLTVSKTRSDKGRRRCLKAAVNEFKKNVLFKA